MDFAFMEYIEKGGVIMYVLFALNFIGYLLMLSSFLLLIYSKFNKSNIIESILKNQSYEVKTEISIKIFKDELTSKIKSMEFGLNTVKIIATISPLLGLLGTVIGVFTSFDAISKSGLEDPSVFAEGISVALITTVGGLIVAIPHYIGYNFLIGTVDALEIELEKELFKEYFGVNR